MGSRQIVAAAAWLLVAATATADVLLPSSVVVAVLFTLPLIVCGGVGSTGMLWSMTAAVLTLTFVDYFAGVSSTQAALEWAAVVNRSLAAFLLLLVASMVHLRITSEASLRLQQRTLEAQNAELEELNEELSQREEEIVRQNEELQSQTEELERQTEELRVTNEDLAGRERTLEQLLELSRSLTAEMPRSELLDKICETLGLLTTSLASAVLERRGHELAVICHHGFGPEGLRSQVLPYAQSFSSLILSMGQTGYLADLGQRPELVIPQPKEGDALRSALATPLKVHGRSVGTIEIYSAEPRVWDDSQVAMLESLAAQTAISLHNRELLEAIQQERRRFEAAFRTAPFGLLVTDDPQGDAVHLNPAAAAMLGVPLGENIAASTPTGSRLRRSIFRGHEPVSAEQLPLARALAGEEVHGEEFDVRLPKAPSGGLVVLCSAAPIYDGQGRIAGAVAAFADITTHKSLLRELELRRREAEEASVRKTRFLAAVSHDIRTPANAISLMAELIRRSAANPQLVQEIPELAQRLQANTLSLMELVSDVLDVARFDSGKVELVETEFALAELIADECGQVAPLAQDKGIRLVFEPAERPIWLHADRVKLGRILGNLLSNAIKFTQSGSVQVSMGSGPPPEREVEVLVSDTGVGIAPEHLTLIFDEFAQLHNPERDRSKGTGLGLAICKRLIEVMGGSISVQSTLDQGSTFRIALPASCVAIRLAASYGAPGRETKPPLPGQRSGLNLRILLVEDHATTREGTGQILRQEGATVVEVPNGRSALEALEQCSHDVVLLDMMLPDMDGREVLKAIQDDPPPGLKGVVVLTGDLTQERLAEVKNLGADGLIGKPIDVRKMLAALEAYQERPLK
ncbi:MAG: ATP-binding protein [Pirellulales bacterium]